MNRGNNIVAAVIIFFILLFAFAKWGPNIPVSILSQQKGEPLVVTGEGKVFVTPDIAKVTFGIDESGTSLATIQNSVNAKSKNVVTQLKNLGIDEKDIKTISYNVYPNYDYSGSTPRITGYRVSTTYEVTVRNFDKVNNVITTATLSGANIVGAVSFEVNDDTKKQKLQEARQMAVSDAKDKASGLAKAAEVTLGKIINVTETDTPNTQPIPLVEKVGLGGTPQQITPNIQPGETELSVTVSLSFEVR